MIAIVIGALGTIPKSLVKGTGKIGNQGTKRDHLNDDIVEIGKNIAKIPGNLIRLAVTQIPKKTVCKLWCE